MAIQPIDTLDDPRVDDFRNVRDADLVGRRGVFLAEGELVVRALIKQSQFDIRSLFLSEKRLDSMADAISELSDDVPVYVAAQSVMDQVVGFPIHRGVLGSGSCGTNADAESMLTRVVGRGDAPARVLVLEGLANHDNVGGVFRNAAAFGVACVLLDGRTCDPLYRKAIRVSMGAALRVPFAKIDTMHAIGLLRDHGFITCALTPAADAVDVDEFANDKPSDRIALLLGAEGLGLRADSAEAADARVRIPIAQDVDSLNVSVAGAVALHALRAR